MVSRRAFVTGCACCAVSALTPSARAAPAPIPPLEIAPLADNVWRHTSWDLLPGGQIFSANGLIVKGARGVLLLDTTWRTAEMSTLLDRVGELAAGLPVRIAVTHAHDDRMSGLAVARERGVPSLAYVLTQADAPARGLPLADQIWRGRRKRIDLGGRSVELYYPGPAHTRDNIVAFVPDVGVLFGGCMLRAGANTALGNVADADVASWPGAAQRLIGRYGARLRVAVPGHGEPGGAALLAHTLDLANSAAHSAP